MSEIKSCQMCGDINHASCHDYKTELAQAQREIEELTHQQKVCESVTRINGATIKEQAAKVVSLEQALRDQQATIEGCHGIIDELTSKLNIQLVRNGILLNEQQLKDAQIKELLESVAKHVTMRSEYYAQILNLVEALGKIANEDYRGNRSNSSVIAFNALAKHRKPSEVKP